MDAVVTLEAVEACEAVRAYLVLRGALPAHGKVLSVDVAPYGAGKVSAKVEILEPPVAEVPTQP